MKKKIEEIELKTFSDDHHQMLISDYKLAVLHELTEALDDLGTRRLRDLHWKLHYAIGEMIEADKSVIKTEDWLHVLRFFDSALLFVAKFSDFSLEMNQQLDKFSERDFKVKAA